jgi:septal ring factor EnvC (AmiA/AmiB activator)
VAIIYSFVQNSASITHAQRLASASSPIDQTVGTLSEVRNKITDAVDSLGGTEEKISKTTEVLSQLLATVGEVKDSVGKMQTDFSTLAGSLGTKAGSVFSAKETKSVISAL